MCGSASYRQQTHHAVMASSLPSMFRLEKSCPADEVGNPTSRSDSECLACMETPPLLSHRFVHGSPQRADSGQQTCKVECCDM